MSTHHVNHQWSLERGYWSSLKSIDEAISHIDITSEEKIFLIGCIVAALKVQSDNLLSKLRSHNGENETRH